MPARGVLVMNTSRFDTSVRYILPLLLSGRVDRECHYAVQTDTPSENLMAKHSAAPRKKSEIILSGQCLRNSFLK